MRLTHAPPEDMIALAFPRMIRPVQATDAPAIAAIYADYVANTTISFETTPPTAEQMLQRILTLSASYPYLVWEQDGRILGYCYAHAWKERPAYAHTWESTIYLSPQAKGLGIGSALMHRLIQDCRATGCHALIACITGNNTASQLFHEKLGFTKVSHFPQVGYKFNQWLDVLDYQLCL